MPKHINSPEAAKEVSDNNDTFLFDCDGVSWRGGDLLPHTVEMSKSSRDHKKRLIFVTNNSTKSRKVYVSKFNNYGIEADFDDVFGSAFSAAVYLSNHKSFDKKTQKVLVIGEKGLEEESHDAGIETVGGSDPTSNKPFSTEDEAKSAVRDPKIGAVVCGLDTHINYLKLAMAQAQLRDPKVVFIATNIDSTFPSSGKVLPGAGTIIRAVSYCSDREPEAVLGKPSKAMMDCIKAKFQFDPKRAVMVGDRSNTDMVFGRDSGLSTLFVLSGIDSLEGISKSGVDPTYYAESLGDVYELLQKK